MNRLTGTWVESIVPPWNRMQRDHRFAKRHMSEALDGELTPRRRARVARHVEECPECGPMLRGLIRMRGVLRTFAARPGGDSVVAGVLDRLRLELDEPESRRTRET